MSDLLCEPPASFDAAGGEKRARPRKLIVHQTDQYKSDINTKNPLNKSSTPLSPLMPNPSVIPE